MPFATNQAPLGIADRNVRGRSRCSTIAIVLAAAAIGTSGWVAAAFQIKFERGVVEREAIAQNNMRAMMLQQYVLRTLDSASIATRHIAELEGTAAGSRLKGTPNRPAGISGPIARNRAFLGLSVVDSVGNIVGSTLEGGGHMGNVRDHPAFAVHVRSRSDELFVSKPAVSRLLRRKVIWLSRRLDDSKGAFAGVVAINMDPAQLSSIYEEAAVKKSEVAWVVGLDGVVRSRRTSYEVTAGEDIRSSQMFQLQAGSTKGAYVAEGPIDHQPRYVSQRTVPGYPLFVSYTVRQADVLAPAEAHARVFLIGALLITIITALLAASLLGALTRRERLAADLAAAKQRLEEAQRVGGIGDWQVAASTDESRWSPQMFRLYHRDPALGEPSSSEFESWLEPKSRETHRKSAELVRETGEPSSWEIVMQLPDGTVHQHVVSGVASRGDRGEIVGLYGTTQDISDRKRLEALQAQLAHLGRIDAMNSMASTLAHELNQPLMAASTYLSAGRRMVLDPDRSREKAAEVVDLAGSQISVAGEIIRRVRSMIARDPTRLEAVPLHAVLDDVQSLLPAIGIDNRVQIRRALQAGATTIVADRVQVQQVLLNLIRNAAQALADFPDATIMICSAPDVKNLVRISVEDNGPGFPGPGEALFSPFVTEKQDGLGLGLSISRTIVESHGGRIWAENREQGGGRVSFTLAGSQSRAAAGQG